MVHIALLLTMLCWGLNAVVFKILLESIGSNSIILLRVVVAGAFLIFVYLVRNKKCNLTLGLIDLVYVALAGLFYIYLQLILYFFGLENTTASNAVILASLSPIVAMKFESCTHGKKFTTIQKIGVTLALLGVITSLQKPNFDLESYIGCVLIFLSVISANLGGVLIQKLTIRDDPLRVSVLLHLSGMLFIVLGAIIFGSLDVVEITAIGLNEWLLLIIFAVVSGGIATIVWSWGISVLGISTTSFYLPLVPVFGLISCLALEGNTLSLLNSVGVFLVLLGTAMSTEIIKKPFSKTSYF